MYTSEDIKQLAADIIAGLGGIVPNTGVNIIGKEIIPQILTLENTTTPLTFETLSVSISNIGDGDGEVNDILLPAGATVNFAAGLNNWYAAGTFRLNALGTQFLITTNNK